METQEIVQQDEVQAESLYEPTAEQVERAYALRRFNLLFVYVPIGLISAIVVVLVVILLIVAIGQTNEQSLLFLSGLADVALVIALLPVIVIGAVLLGLIGYGYAQGRRSGMAPIRQTQRLLWRMDNLVGRLRVRTEQTADSVARPFLTLNGAAAYARTLFAQLINMVKRS